MSNLGSSLLKIVAAIAFVVVICIFWRPILWVIIILVVFFAIWIGVVLYRANKIKKEMDKDPEAYFDQQRQQQEKEASKDVIDAEYTEKEVVPEKEKTNVH
jgi:flagellar biosynthesis/type III secretory pathway M-ring protein FliF/YscJ